jgi:glycosyltransferase involved in cell wall biosynthesis
VNTHLFNPELVYTRPADLPAGRRILMYVGALWGEWFDWDLLGYLADSNPEAQVVLIGDYLGQAPYQKSNVHFLGLKAQKELPAYLAYSDVSLLPWKVTPITLATSPLKVYEYLAMRLPVVIPPLEPLRDMPGVFVCDSREEFSRVSSSVMRHQQDEKAVGEFIRHHNWTARLDVLLDYLDQE